MFLFEELFIKEDFQLRAAVRRMVQAICLTAITTLSLTVSAQPLSSSGTIEGRVQSSDGNEAGPTPKIVPSRTRIDPCSITVPSPTMMRALLNTVSEESLPNLSDGCANT